MVSEKQIGYACLTLGTPKVGLKTCRLKNASEENLIEITKNNLDALENMILYNIKNDIRLFRISSDIIPFGSHPQNSIKWCDYFSKKIKDIGNLIKQSQMRVSMHPGHFTLLSAKSEEVVKRSVDDLKYHCYFLDCLDVDCSNKVVLHIGGLYGDKEETVKRFVHNFSNLEESIKKRIVLENDERNYDILDVFELSKKLNVPVVFDVFHHSIKPPSIKKSLNEWIVMCNKTWKVEDGTQKIHYSQQDTNKKLGAHSRTILTSEFTEFYNKLPDINLDIMLEVKDKNLSAIKCILCAQTKNETFKLEHQWAKYKYYVLGKYPQGYKEIRELLKDKASFYPQKFYLIVEYSILHEGDIGQEINAATHVFGYFKKNATKAEKLRILNMLKRYKDNKCTITQLKKSLKNLTDKYEIEYLQNSYYFINL